MSPSPQPQLGRKRINLCGDDESSDSSLSILSPIKRRLPTDDHEQEDRKPAAVTSMTNNHSKFASLMESDDSSDDEILNGKPIFARKSGAATKRPLTSTTRCNSMSGTATTNNETREEARLRKKQETLARKRAEKLEKTKKREQERAEREHKKSEERASRKRQVEEQQQSSGKYAHKEIAILMDPSLFWHQTMGIVEALKEDFLVHSHHSPMDKAIQWIRKDYLMGGAKDALTKLEQDESDEYESLPYLVLVLEAEDFLPLLQRECHDVDDNYPALETYLTNLKAKWQQTWKTTKQPRVIFILHKVPETLDRQWVIHRRKNRNTSNSPPTEFELHDAMQWLLIQFQTECIHCPSYESVQANVHKLTRAICEGPYTKNVSELQCIKKIKSTLSGESTPFERARDTWLRQLQQMPRLSENHAYNVVQHYPTMKSLWEAYQHGDEATNSALVADILSETRREAKLSDHLYRCMTTTNPKEMLL